MEMYHVPFWYVNYSWLMSHYNRCTCAHCRAVVALTVYATIQQTTLLHKRKPCVYNGIGAVQRSAVWVRDIALIIMGLWASCTHRGRRIFMWASLTSWLVVISGTSLTLSMQKLTCYGGLLPTSNKLSNFLHLSWGSLVSFVWQAPCLQVGFLPREGRASSRGKLSSFCQTTGKTKSLSLPLFLCLCFCLSPPPLPLFLSLSLSLWHTHTHTHTHPLSIFLSVSACSPGADLHFPGACYAPLSLAVQNKQASVRGWKRQVSPRSQARRCVNPLTVASWGPQQLSQCASWEWHRDSQLDWGERRSMCPSLGRDERLYRRDDAHHST